MRNVNLCKLSRVLLLLLSQGPQTPQRFTIREAVLDQGPLWPGVPGNVCGWRMLGCCYQGADTAGPSVCEIQEVFIPAQAPVIPATLSPRGIPTEEVETFTVAVPTKNFVNLGLELEVTEARAPMISSVEEGAVQEFNKVYEHSRIQPFDVLLALDGTHSWEAIQEKLTSKLPDKMFLTLNRPRKIQVAMENTGNMGITLASSDKSAAVIIQELHPSGDDGGVECQTQEPGSWGPWGAGPHHWIWWDGLLRHWVSQSPWGEETLAPYSGWSMPNVRQGRFPSWWV